MRKRGIKILLIVAILLIVMPFIITAAKSSENIYLNVQDKRNMAFNATNVTKKDDLETNIYKGELKANDEEITESNNKHYTLYLNRELCIFKIKNNKTGYIYSSALDEIPETAATSYYGSYISSTFSIEYYKKYLNKDNNEYELSLSTNTDTTGYINHASKLRASEKEALGEVDQYYMKIERNSDVKIDYSSIDKGIKVVIKFEKIGFEITAYVTIDDNGLHVNIKDEEIKENDHKIASIDVMPTLGATYNNQTKGYMVIPDGSGALIRYGEVTTKLGNRPTINFYDVNMGADLNLKNEYTIGELYNLNANCFGLINGIKQDGVYGIIEEGAYHAQLMISPCGTNNVMYNYLTCRFIKRYVYLEYEVNQKVLEIRNNENINMLYRFLSDDDATYVGMANDYSDYLVNNEAIKKNNDNTYKTRIDYLLSETSKGLIGNKNNTMTTLDDISEMYEYFKNQGINQTIILKGWNKKGLSGATPYTIKYNTKIGSKREFKELIENIQKEDDVYFYNDYVIGYDQGNINVRNDVARSTRSIKMSYTNEDAVLYKKYYLLNPSSSLEIANNDINRYQKLDMTSLAIDHIGSILFTYIENKVYKHRVDAYKTYDEILKNLDEDFNIGLFMPNNYMYKYLDSYFDMPLYANPYTYYTDNVPFIPYILRTYVDMYSQYVNFFASSNIQRLRMLDYGVFPSYILTSKASYNLKYTNSVDMYTTNYNDWYNTIIENNNFLKNGYNATIANRVISRDILDNGIVKIIYDNNTSLIINYTDSLYKYNEYNVMPQNYLFIGGTL